MQCLRWNRKLWLLITIFAFSFFFSLPSQKKEGRENENEIVKIVIKSHTFLFHQCSIQILNFLLRSLFQCLEENVWIKKKLGLRMSNYGIHSILYRTKQLFGPLCLRILSSLFFLYIWYIIICFAPFQQERYLLH